MMSFTFVEDRGTSIFALLDGGQVMFHRDPNNERWMVSTSTGRHSETRLSPTVLIQESFDYVSGRITWNEFVLKIQEVRD